MKTKTLFNKITLPALLCGALLYGSTHSRAAIVDYSDFYWTGSANSSWGNLGNWLAKSGASTIPATALPAAGQYIGFAAGSAPLLVMSNTASGDLNYTIGGVSVTPSSSAYKLVLQGNSAGRMNLTVNKGGFYSVNNASSDMPITVQMDANSRINYTGKAADAANASGRATLFGAKVIMKANSELLFNAGASAVNIASLDTEVGSKIYVSGSNYLQISGASILRGEMTCVRTGTNEAFRTNSNADFTLTPTGVITLTDTNAYGLVRYGNFFINGKMNGNMRTQGGSNSYLGGTGVINGNVTLAEGTLLGAGMKGRTPGNNILTINGNVATSGTNPTASSSFSFYFYNNNTNDQLVINGNLDLSAASRGMLSVGPSSSDYVFKTGRAKLLTFSGNMTGEFSQTIASRFTLASTLRWERIGNEIWLDMERNSFAIAGLTPNQTVIAKMLDPLEPVLPDVLVLELDQQITAQAYGKVLNALGAQSYQSWFPSAVVQVSQMGTALERRLAVPDLEYRTSKKFDIYMDAARYDATNSTNGNNEYYEFKPWQIIVGADYAFSPSLLSGVFYARDQSDYILDDSGSSGTSKVNTYGVYGRYRKGNTQFDLMGFYGTDSYTANRSVQYSNLGTFATASTSGSQYGARGLITYTFKPAWFDVVPTFGMQYMHWEADGFAERGNANETTLQVAKQSADSCLLSTGVQVARSFTILDGNAQIRPFFTAYWQFETQSGARNLTSTVMGQTITLQSTRPHTSGWHIEGGISVDYLNGLSLFASYANDNNVTVNQTVAVRGGVGYRF